MFLSLSLALLFVLNGTGCGMAYVGEEPIPRSTKFTGFVGRLVDSETGDAVQNAKVMVRPVNEMDAGRPFYIYSMGDGSFQLSHFKRKGVSSPFDVGEEYQLVISSVHHRIKDFTVVFDGGEQKLGAIELLRVEEGGPVEMVISGEREDQERPDLPTPPRMGPPLP